MALRASPRRDDKHREHGEPGRSPQQRRAPPAGGADAHDDRDHLDRLDRRGQERRDQNGHDAGHGCISASCHARRLGTTAGSTSSNRPVVSV